MRDRPGHGAGRWCRFAGAAGLLAFISLGVFTLGAHAAPQVWPSLSKDGIHDPTNPAIGILQQPIEALSLLPTDTTGNLVRWVDALQEGYIDPVAEFLGQKSEGVRVDEILMTDTSIRPFVLFPHKPHTEWLNCANCHDQIFKKKAGATPVNMLAILQGEYCGRCHGAVAFPLTECNRCHSVPQSGSRQRR